MSENEDGAEKTFEPTQKRLEDARRKGDIPKSNDLTTAASYLALILILTAFGISGMDQFSRPLIAIISQSHLLALPSEGWSGSQLMGALLSPMLFFLSAMFLGPAVGALLSLFAQRALTFAPSKLAPKLNRISPIKGAKNKFGANGIFEFLKSSTKLTIISVGCYAFLAWNIELLLGAASQTPSQLFVLMGQLLLEFGLLVCLLMFCIGGVDYLWQVFEHQRKNMMTRKEVEDETKESEGDPHLKQERRSRAYEIATNQMLSDVPDASVVIVNPTHFAVALKWDRSGATAPICVAKGVDEIAARIREAADASDVPIYSDPPTARAIFATVDLGQEIDREHFRAVASAIRFAERAREKSRASVT